MLTTVGHLSAQPAELCLKVSPYSALICFLQIQTHHMCAIFFPANDMFLRSWSMMFLVVLSFKAIFESNPERYERWLRLLQVACFFFVVDCFVLQQQVRTCPRSFAF